MSLVLYFCGATPAFDAKRVRDCWGGTQGCAFGSATVWGYDYLLIAVQFTRELRRCTINESACTDELTPLHVVESLTGTGVKCGHGDQPFVIIDWAFSNSTVAPPFDIRWRDARRSGAKFETFQLQFYISLFLFNWHTISCVFPCIVGSGQKFAHIFSHFNGFDWSLLVKHLVIEYIHNS